MKLAMVIPTYTITPELAIMTINHCKVWKEQNVDLILCEDGGGFFRGLYDIADLYILHKNIGVAANSNLGWRIALMEREADFVAIVDSDVSWAKGNLNDLCIPGKVGIPINRRSPGSRRT